MEKSLGGKTGKTSVFIVWFLSRCLTFALLGMGFPWFLVDRGLVSVSGGNSAGRFRMSKSATILTLRLIRAMRVPMTDIPAEFAAGSMGTGGQEVTYPATPLAAGRDWSGRRLLLHLRTAA